jgi:hypothetical protein
LCIQHACVHACVHTRERTSVCACRLRARTHTHTHTHTHTRTEAPFKVSAVFAAESMSAISLSVNVPKFREYFEGSDCRMTDVECRV